jgi:GNAT superfamily N-acetyltransferase
VSDWPQPWQAANVQLSLLPPEEWKRVYLSDSFDPLDGANRVRALSRSSSLVYAHLSDESGPAAAGAASFSQGWVGLHGLRTVTDARRKGYAQALIAALGTVAVSKGINRSFLQVEEGNLPAIDLYRRLGFQTAWRYHYWRRES